LLIVKIIFVITVFFLFLLCVSTILVNKDDYTAVDWRETSSSDCSFHCVVLPSPAHVTQRRYDS